MSIFKSRKVRVAILDLVCSVVLYFAGKYAAPGLADDIHFLIMSFQPVFLLVIGGIAYEDGQAKKAGTFGF